MKQSVLCKIRNGYNNYIVNVKVESKNVITNENKTEIQNQISHIIANELADNPNFELHTLNQIYLKTIHGDIKYRFNTSKEYKKLSATLIPSDKSPIRVEINPTLKGHPSLHITSKKPSTSWFSRSSPSTKPVLKDAGLIFMQDPHSVESLSNSINLLHDLQAFQSNPQLGTAFHSAVEHDKSWRRGTDEQHDQSIQADVIAISRLFEGDGNQVAPHIIITGYWDRKGIFQPLLLTFHREGNDLHLTETGYGAQREHIRDFIWKNFNPNAHDAQPKISLLLQHLLLGSKKPAEQKDTFIPDTLRAGYLGTVATLVGSSVDGAARMMSPDSLKSLKVVADHLKVRENLIMSQGFNKNVKKVKRRTVVEESPLKLIQETIRLIEPGSVLSSKKNFNTLLLTNLLEATLRDLDSIELTDRPKLLKELKRQCESLERQFKKVKGDVATEEDTRHLKEMMKTLAQVIERDELIIKAKETQMEALNAPVQEDYHVAIDTAQINTTSEKKVGAKKVKGLTTTDLQNIEIFKTMINVPTPENIPEIARRLTELTQRCNELVAQKQHPVAVEFYHLVMSAIPTPHHPQITDVEVNFWKVLDDRVIASKQGILPLPEGRRPSHLYREVSLSMERLSHFFWEAKVKMNDLKLTPEEWIAYIKTEMALVRTIRQQAAFLRLLRLDQKTPEEIGFQTALGASSILLEVQFSKRFLLDYQRENYLALSQSAENQSVLDALNQMYNAEEAQFKSFRLNEVYSANNQEEQWIESSNMALSEENRIQWKDFLSPRTYQGEGGKKALSPLSELRRHHLAFVSLLSPASSIQAYGFTPFVGAALKSFFSKKNTEELVTESHLKSMEKIRGFARLEFSTDERIFGTIKGCGIVPANHKSGSKISFELDRSEVSDSASAAGLRWKIPVDYTPDAGHPNKYYDPTDQTLKDTEPKAQIYGKEISITVSQDHRTWHKAMDSRNNITETSMISLAQTVSGNSYELSALQTIRFNFSNEGEKLESAINVEEVVDMILNRPDFLDDPSKYRRFYEIMTRPHVVKQAVVTNPDYFREVNDLLKSIVDTAIKAQNFTRATRLLYLTSLIAIHLDQPTRANWPTVENIEYENSILETVTREDSSQENKYDAATLYLLKFYLHPSANRPQDIPGLFHQGRLNAEVVARIIRMGGLLTNVAETLTIPLNAKVTITWAKEQLVNFLLQQHPQELPVILEMVLNPGRHLLSTESIWTASVENPRVFSKTEGGLESIVDLYALQVIKKEGVPPEGIEVTIPDGVQKNQQYQNLFGKETTTTWVQLGSKVGDSIYTFTMPGKGRFRITYNAMEQKVVIEREFAKLDRKGPRFILYTIPKMQELSETASSSTSLLTKKLKDTIKELGPSHEPYGLEERLLERGIFIDPLNPKKGIAFLKTNEKSGEFEKRVDLEFDSTGKLREAKMEDGKKVVHAPGAKLEKVLGPLSTQQILYLANPRQRWVSEIQFLDHDFSLRRASENGPWILEGHPTLSGAELQSGSNRTTAVRNLLSPLGLNFEQCGLVLRKNNNSFLLMWPREVKSDKAHKVEILDFNNIPEGMPPLILEVSDNQEVTGSCAGFLALGYLFAARHDYDKAVYYINRAVNTRISDQHEAGYLGNLDGAFRNLSARSLRSNAVALKGLLAIRRIATEQIKEDGPGKNWREFLEDNTPLAEFYEGYQTASERSVFSNPQYMEVLKEHESEFTLTDEELSQLKIISLQSLLEATPLLETRVEKGTLGQTETAMAIDVVKEEEMKSAVLFAIIGMVEPLADPEILLKNLEVDETILEHFFDLWNLIIDRQLTPEHLSALFLPTRNIHLESAIAEADLQESKPFEPEKTQQFTKTATIELARRALLTLASRNRGGAPEPHLVKANTVELWKIHEKLPAGKFTATVKSIWLGLKTLTGHTSTEEAFIENINTEIINLASNVRWVNGKIAYNQEIVVVPSQTIPVDILTQKVKRGVDLNKLTAILNTPEGRDLFGPDLTPLLLSELNNQQSTIRAEASKANGVIPLTKVVEELEAKFSINIINLGRLWKNRVRIAELEHRAQAPFAGPMVPTSSSSVGPIPSSSSSSIPTPTLEVVGEEFPLLVSNYLTAEARNWWNNINDNELQAQTGRLQLMREQFNTVIGAPKTGASTANDGVRKTEKNELIEGIETSAQEIEEELRNKKSLTAEGLTNLHNFVIEKTALHEQESSYHHELLSILLKTPGIRRRLPKEVRVAMLKKKTVGEEPVWRALKKAYQSGELNSVTELNVSMTHILLHDVSIKILNGRAKMLISELDILQQDNQEGSASWISASTKLFNLLNGALDHGRYLDDNSHLKDPSLYRKVLVMEASKGIVLTKDQLDLVIKMVKKPADWYELKVGLGKTSVVFPLVLLMLIEKGKHPSAIVKDALLQQNLASLDSSSRDLIEGAGVAFTFSIQDPCTALSLQERYMKLLEVKNQNGYIITTSAALIGIDQKLQLLRSMEKERITEIKSPKMMQEVMNLERIYSQTSQNPNATSGNDLEKYKELIDKINKLDDLHQQLYYLSKIRSHFQLLIIDEVDDVCDVTSEKNIGLGAAAELSPEIRKVLGLFFQVGMNTLRDNRPTPSSSSIAAPAETSASSTTETQSIDAMKARLFTDPDFVEEKVKELFTAIASRNQASLDPDYLKEVLLPALVLKGFSSRYVMEELKITVAAQKELFGLAPAGKKTSAKHASELKRKLVEYFCLTNGVDPFTPDQWDQLSDETKRYLSALKYQIQQSLPITLSQNPGIDSGTKSDGYQVRPLVAGEEKEGTVYGGVHDILSNHFVSYLSKITPSTFFQNALKKIKTIDGGDIHNRNSYLFWKHAAEEVYRDPEMPEEQKILLYLNQPENWDLRLYLLEKSVIGPQNIKIYLQQIVFNSQDVTYGRSAGGMTGTRNAHALPSLKVASSEPQAKTVTAQVLLEATLLGTPAVEVHQAPRSLVNNPMFDRLKDIIRSDDRKECRAIINQGFDLECPSSLDVVTALREADPTRIYVYIDTKERNYRIWRPGEEPQKIQKDALDREIEKKEYRDNVLCYFAPPDTRGTDVRLPGGYAIAMVSEKCSEEDMVQLLGRMRDAGQTQHLKHLLISEGVANRIAKNSGVAAENLTYAHIIDDIVNMSAPNKASKNLKAASESFRRVTTMGIRSLLNQLTERMDSIDYWSLQRPRERMADTHLRQQLGEAVTDWLCQSKKVDFEADRSPVTMEPTRENFIKLYTAEREKLANLRKTINTMENIMTVGTLTGNPQIIHNFLQNLTRLEHELDVAWNDFERKVTDTDRPIFADTVPSSGAGLAKTHAQVQVQQQQQQQVQQQQQSQQKIENTLEQAKKFVSVYYSRESLRLAIDTFNSTQRLRQGTEIELDIPDRDKHFLFQAWDELDVTVTPTLIANFAELRGFRGSLLNARILLQSTAGGRIHMTIISKSDYHDALVRNHLLPENSMVVSLMPTHLDPQSNGFRINRRRGISFPATDAEIRKRVLLAKIFMGLDNFDKNEIAELKQIVASLKSYKDIVRQGLIIHAQRFGDIRQEELINKLF